MIYIVFTRAIDEKRHELLVKSFSPRSQIKVYRRWQEFARSGAEAADYFKNFLNLCYGTNHLIGSPSVELSGEKAFATARVQAVHQQILKDGTVSRWILRICI